MAGSLLCVGCQSEKPGPTDTGSPPPSSLKVSTVPARKEAFATVIKLSGQVQATEDRTVLLTAPLDGVVRRPLVRVGTLVQQEQPLVEMNSVYGMTGLQILEKLETQQDQLVSAQARLSQALSDQNEARKALGQARSQVSSLTSDLRQAEADLAFAQSDLRRKIDLLNAGISSKAEVEEATTRQTKALALTQASAEELRIAKRQIPLFEKNINQYEVAVKLAGEAVRINRANFDRSRSVYSQSALVGTEIPPELTALVLGHGAANGAAAQASTFYLRAPIGGVVTKLGVTSGQRVSSGAEMGQVVELSKIYVDANAFEGDIARLRVGDAINVTSPSAPGAQFKGKVRYIGQQVNPQTHTIQVRSLLDNPGGRLRPDTFVDVSISLPPRADAVVVPSQALLTLGNQQYVMVKEGDRYVKRSVVVGARSLDKIEIVQGLKEGEEVVTEGGLLLESRE